MKPKDQNNSIVQSKGIAKATLVRFKPNWQSLIIAPFVLAYSIWIAWAFQILAHSSTAETNSTIFDSLDTALIILSIVLVVHLLTILVTLWSVPFYAFVWCSKQSFVHLSDSILIIPSPHRGSPVLCSIDKSSLSFIFQKKKFIYNPTFKKFMKISWPLNNEQWDPMTHQGWQTTLEINQAESLYGLNKLDIPMPKFMELFKDHAIAPFFVFQLFCVLLWTLDDYWYHSLFTLFMLFVFEATVVMQRLKNMSELRGMSPPPISVQVKRCNQWSTITSDSLLPGDIIRLDASSNNNLMSPCDMIITKGICVVNEALLSGESTPLRKEALLPSDDSSQSLPMLFGGTQLLEGNCEAVVFRTGFRTAQGKLVRTMFYGEERITANNIESFFFILFLLIFALFAAGYVWTSALYEDPDRSRFKLLVKCLLIITAVVPPELPMELSLAVNSSLMALSKLAIFCVEPFRIPFGGKIDVCCFDKTGTLTETRLVVQGCSGIENDVDSCQSDHMIWPLKTKIVLATCHSLVSVKDQPAGDPLEKATLESTQFKLGKHGDSIIPSKSSYNISHINIIKRFPFSSSLRRMSVIGQCYPSKGNEKPLFFASAKGAPEVIKDLLTSPPEWYDRVYMKYAEQGGRVLALGYKLLESGKDEWTRSNVESGLEFVGFVVMSCPIKQDAFSAIRSLQKSRHKTVMITGDHSLTAIHVAKELHMNGGNNEISLLDNVPGFVPKNGIDYCITGPIYEQILQEHGKEYFKNKILSKIIVFARFSPSNKEDILSMYKELGWMTLMCGDGTNDVGALKRAHIGVALLDGTEEDVRKMEEHRRKQMRLEWEKRRAAAMGGSSWKDLMDQVQDDELPRIKFGDASIAAPFTSKIGTIESVCHLVRQGRCTLVTTVQMYKILALNSLIIAYALSVLHLAGVRQGDFQLTISGMLLASCFLFLSRASPLKNLSAKRPPPSIFTSYMMLSILGQFVIHLTALISLQSFVVSYEPLKKVAEDAEFAPSLLNSAMYILTLMMQVSTFAMNYSGHPFREGLSENRGLLNALLIVGGIAFLCASESFPELNEWLQLVPFPDDVFRKHLLGIMAADLAGCWVVEWITNSFLANYNPGWMN